VPDFYQGSELWNFSLVDPDNRRPVDFAASEKMMEELDGLGQQNPEAAMREVIARPEDGRAKLWFVSRALRFRRANPELFGMGTYIPLRAMGEHRSHVIAFARGFGAQLVIAVAGRFFAKSMHSDHDQNSAAAWENSELAVPRALESGSYRDIFTERVLQPESRRGRSVLSLREVFSCCPVALLERL